MSVSLTPWLSEFHAVCYSGRSGGLLFLDWLLPFFWLCTKERCFYLCPHLGQNLPSFSWILIPWGKEPLYESSSGSSNPGQLDRGRFNCLSFSIPGGVAPQPFKSPFLSVWGHLEVKMTGTGDGHFYKFWLIHGLRLLKCPVYKRHTFQPNPLNPRNKCPYWKWPVHQTEVCFMLCPGSRKFCSDWSSGWRDDGGQLMFALLDR